MKTTVNTAFLLLLLAIAESVSFGSTIEFDSLRVLFINRNHSDIKNASKWMDILKDDDIKYKIVEKNFLSENDFDGMDVIIIGPNTAERPLNPSVKWYNYWGKQSIVNIISLSNIPVLGISFGGMCLFGQMNLPIGGGHFAHGNGKNFIVTDKGWDYLQKPHKISPQKGSILNVSSRAQSYDGFHKPPVFIEGIVQVPNSKDYFPIVRYKKYLVWGCGGSPKYLTQEGKKLFSNLVYSLAGEAKIRPYANAESAQKLPKPPKKSYRPSGLTSFMASTGFNLVAGYSGSFWNPIIRSPFKKETFGTQLGYFEVWYDNYLIQLGEKLKLFNRPYINLQTDFGMRTSSEVISKAERSSVEPSGNLKLLMKVNYIEPLFFKYRKEIFVGQLTCEDNFTFYPYEGEPVMINAGSELFLTTEFNDYEMGISFVTESPFYWRGFYRIEVGGYRAVWQRPITSKITYIDSLTGAEIRTDYELYHALNDFYGLTLGLYYFKDIYDEGEFFRSFDYGIGIRSGGFGLGKTKLTSTEGINRFVEEGKKASCSEIEFTANGRLYWRLLETWDLGLNFDYTFKKVFASEESEDIETNEESEGTAIFVTEDNIFLITLIFRFAP